MASNNGSGAFPGPYTSTIKADDPMMKRVPMDHQEIGSRPSAMPKGLESNDMTISHVGGQAGPGNGR